MKDKYLLKTKFSPYFKRLPHLNNNFNLTSQAVFNGVTLFAGYDKEDMSKGFIAYIYEDKSADTFVVKHLTFEGKGTIELREILDKKNIITFTYNDNQKGYFDIDSKEAFFVDYQ